MLRDVSSKTIQYISMLRAVSSKTIQYISMLRDASSKQCSTYRCSAMHHLNNAVHIDA
jgi:hypothetical protein